VSKVLQEAKAFAVVGLCGRNCVICVI